MMFTKVPRTEFEEFDVTGSAEAADVEAELVFEFVVVAEVVSVVVADALVDVDATGSGMSSCAIAGEAMRTVQNASPIPAAVVVAVRLKFFMMSPIRASFCW